jgi:hypothetical protein
MEQSIYEQKYYIKNIIISLKLRILKPGFTNFGCFENIFFAFGPLFVGKIEFGDL